jgi:hypothetical protein
MSAIQINFVVNGQPVTGFAAQSHFVEWGLALEQEHNQDIILLTGDDRCALELSRIFQIAAYQPDSLAYPYCVELAQAAGITISRKKAIRRN